MSRNKIKFHKEYEEWGEFSNFFSKNIKIKAAIPSKLTVNGEPATDSVWLTPELNWPTSEHLFQAMKFSEKGKENLAVDVSKISTAKDARKFPGKRYRSDWHSGTPPYKVRVMRYVVRKKFSQNDVVKDVLLRTNNDILIEDTQIATSYDDPFWGNGWSGVGENWLGRILEEIRAELKTSDRIPPTPPITPPLPSPAPNDGEYLDNSEIHVFKTKVETELSNQKVAISDLNSKYQDLFNYIGTKKWKAGELDSYENDLKKEIKRVANEKNKPLPSPNANQNYRDRWVQALEKQFQELEFGDQHDTITKRLSEIKNKIKENQFDTEEKVDSLARKFLDILKKLGKSKSGTDPINNPNSPSPVPNSQNPPIPENEKTPEPTPEEKASLLNELEDLNQKTPEDLGKEEDKPIEINKIKKYFEDNGISSITLEENGDLTIKFQNKTTQTTLANNEQLQLVKKYLWQKSEKLLNREKLNIGQNSNHFPTKPNYLPYILVIGGIVILVIFSALIVFRRKRIKKRK